MTMIYHEDAGDLSVLIGRPIAVLGYGSLGRSIALNLRDSGVQVFVGVRTTESAETARADGLTPLSIEAAAQAAPILFMLLPDEVMPAVYLEQVSPHLRKGSTLVFASGYNVAFGYIEAPPFVNVGMIAPRTFGLAVRERFLSGEGFLSFVSVGQDASGNAWQTVLALARAAGSLKAGALEVTMEQEAELDLFFQQAILPVFHNMILTAANLLMRQGYPPEALFSQLYLSGEFGDYLRRAEQTGLMPALALNPLTAQYGTLNRMDRFDDLKLERLMEITLREIRDGAFSREWRSEYSDGYPRLRKLMKQHSDLDLWELERQTLEMLGLKFD